MTTHEQTRGNQQPTLEGHMPSAEVIQRELASAQSLDDFFGKDGVLARLFARTIEQILQVEMKQHLGYERYAARGRNSGNSRHGKTPKKVRTSLGDTVVTVRVTAMVNLNR